MLTCAQLSKNVALGSCAQRTAQVSGRVIAINFDDWQAATITEASGIISAITLPSGKYGYALTSKDKGIEASYSMNKGTYGNSWIHQLLLRVFDRTQDNKDTMDKLADGRFVFIVEHLDKANYQTVYEVYGRDNGLTASAAEGSSTDADGQFGNMTMASEEGAYEGALPTSIFNTDLATTKAAIEALIAS